MENAKKTDLVAFVILHFVSTDDTTKCIESIAANVKYTNYKIVLVDNGSPNKSGAELANIYQDNDTVDVILHPKNLGFARGNNLGYAYARDTLKSKFIFVINSDTIIEQNDFVEVAIRRYKQKPFHIAGPDIISLVDHGHQNPRIEALRDKASVYAYARTYRVMYWLSLFNLDLLFLKIKKRLRPGSKLPSAISDTKASDKEQEDVKLHGSALIFSPDYIERYEYCFYPITYMYCEESVLFYISKRDQLKTLYLPSVKIYHKEDGATDTYLKSKRKKRTFYYKYFSQSSFAFHKLMMQSEKEH